MTLSTEHTTDRGTAMEAVAIQGDLSKLSPEQRVSYYHAVCSSLGLNPYTSPFAYLSLNGQLRLYAKKDATDQLRRLHRVSLEVVSREQLDEHYLVTVRATTPDGRSDEEIGAVAIGGLKGEALANAWMRSITKAKRRATLSICGLGYLDETEVETIPDAVVHEHVAPVAPRAAPPAAAAAALPVPLVPGEDPRLAKRRSRWRLLVTAAREWGVPVPAVTAPDGRYVAQWTVADYDREGLALAGRIEQARAAAEAEAEAEAEADAEVEGSQLMGPAIDALFAEQDARDEAGRAVAQP
jgi:hypothetical protein